MIVMAALLAFISLIIAPDKVNAISAVKQLFDPFSGGIIWQVKMPHMLAAIMAGIILAVSGSVFQGILGNRRISSDYIIWLIGVSVAALIASYIFTIVYVRITPDIWMWSFGDLSTANWYKISLEFPILLLALVVALFYYKDLNALLLGEDVATTLGVYTGAVRAFLLTSATLMAAGGLLLFGMATVILLIAPFFIRMIVGANYKHFFPVSIATVIVMALLSDVVGRATELWSGTLLLVFGIPMIAYIFWSRRSV